MNFDARAVATRSRLPEVGTTIFSVMSALAQAHGAVNLGQGFPDFPGDPALLEAVAAAMRDGNNQYAPMAGWPALREWVANKVEHLYGARYKPDSEVTITAGATQAILTAVLALVQPGDEVIVLEPCYDSYLPAITLAGGVAVRVALSWPGFRPDFERIAEAITPKTRAIIVNTPHNPSGTVWRAEEWAALAAILRGTKVLLISDEVYEHMVFDAVPHASASSLPELVERSVVISSFGKTLHVTGWKIGTVVAPAPLSAEFRKVHQFNVFCVNTPMQVGLSRYLLDFEPCLRLPGFYQRKRDLFRAGLAGTGFSLLPCEGTYFQCVDYAALSPLADLAFCEWLTKTVGVAAIPISAFIAEPTARQIIRFCFAKQDATLNSALERLQAI